MGGLYVYGAGSDKTVTLNQTFTLTSATTSFVPITGTATATQTHTNFEGSTLTQMQYQTQTVTIMQPVIETQTLTESQTVTTTQPVNETQTQTESQTVTTIATDWSTTTVNPIPNNVTFALLLEGVCGESIMFSIQEGNRTLMLGAVNSNFLVSLSSVYGVYQGQLITIIFSGSNDGCSGSAPAQGYLYNNGQLVGEAFILAGSQTGNITWTA